ncbi:MAG: PEP-CTERM sorting domain-containing protein [Rubrivivax sp.]|nr:PEP-CTERM sorting domain-containing protein [Rubrivivax sp.]
MTNSSYAHLLIVAAMTSPAAATSVPDASARMNLIASSTVVLAGREEVVADTFGTHQASYGGALARASATVGANEAVVPFIAYSASASGRSFALATAQLDYYWSVTGTAVDGELIPVTITTLGNVWGQVTARATLPEQQVEAAASWLWSTVSTSIETWSGADGRAEQRGFGASLGSGNTDTTRRSSPGGSVTSNESASFSETFSILLRPNASNRVVMDIYGSPRNSDLYNATSVSYSWALGGYIDPIITIDPAFADRFSVVQSSIPTVAMPVPETSTLFMMLGGLGLLGWLAARRRQA